MTDKLYDEIRQYIKNNTRYRLDENKADSKIIQCVANRFTAHKKTHIQAITSLDRLFRYYEAAKVVGDKELAKSLVDMTGNFLDKYTTGSVEISDNCYDDFNTAVERHLYAANAELYNIFDKHNIKYIDAGLVETNGKYIYFPKTGDILRITNNMSVNEAEAIVQNHNTHMSAPKHDFSSIKPYKDIKSFMLINGKLVLGDFEFELDKDNITEIISTDTTYNGRYLDYEINGIAGCNGYIKLWRNTNLSNIKDRSIIYLLNGLVYFDKSTSKYFIVGNYTLINFHIIESNVSIMYKYNGLRQSYLEKIKLSTPLTTGLCKPFKEVEDEYSEIKNKTLYIARGNTPISKGIRYTGGEERNIDFEDVIKLLEQL